MIVCIVFWNRHYVILYYGKDILSSVKWFVLWSVSPSGAVGGGADIDHGLLSELESRRRELEDSRRRMAHVKPQNLSFSWEPLINQSYYSSWILWIYLYQRATAVVALWFYLPLLHLIICAHYAKRQAKNERKKSHLSIKAFQGLCRFYEGHLKTF